MTKQINAAIIGTGMIAQVHCRAIKAAGGHVAGVIDTDPARAQQMADKWQVNVFATPEEAFQSAEVDVIHVCTPNAFHAELAKQALRAGKHVVCEKPLATNLADAKELYELAEQSGLVNAVPFVYRYHPMVREAKAKIDAGELGPIHLVHGSYLQDWLLGMGDNNWRVDPKQGGASRAFADIGSHWCDLMEWLLGERFVELNARFSTAQKERSTAAVETFSDHVADAADNAPKMTVTTEDIATVMLSTGTDVPASVVISQVSAGRKNRLWFEIDGENKSLVFDQEQPEQLWMNSREAQTLLVRDPTIGSAEQKRLSITPAGHAQGYSHCFEAFVGDVYAAINGEKPFGLPTFADGYRAAQIIDAVLESKQTRAWTDLR